MRGCRSPGSNRRCGSPRAPSPRATSAAIDRLLRVLDRLDRYSAVEGAATSEDAGGREKLLAKLNAMAERMIAARQSGLVDADGRPRPGAGEAALDAADSPDFVDDPAAPSSAGLDVA